jgi:tellurite resistance protein
MTPAEKNIVRSLVAVAWADGKLEQPESGVIEGLLSGFDASADEEAEILEYAKTRRSLEADIPLAEMSEEDRELLLANAALLSHADGEQSEGERGVLDQLVKLLGFTKGQADEILSSVGDGALRLSSRALEPADE